MPRGQKNSYGCRRRRRRTVRDEDRGRGDWGLPFQSDRTHARATEETDRPAAAARRKLVAEIKAVIAELPNYGYRRVHALLKRQALAPGLKPPNHKRGYRGVKVHRPPPRPQSGGGGRRHDGRRPRQEGNRRRGPRVEGGQITGGFMG